MRRTPCIGICSTTYGDLVCRGCKRYAHEIVDWNRYTEDQRARIETRLSGLKQTSVREFVSVRDVALLRHAADPLHVPRADTLDPLVLAYETLRRAPATLDPVTVGLDCTEFGAAIGRDRLFAAIDQEFFIRASAHYERSFRILAE